MMPEYESIGFTGTQIGMTEAQKTTVILLLSKWKPNEFHHGDCVGADETAHAIVRLALPTCKIVIHPPESIFKQAMCKGDEHLQPKAYLVRNHNIVDVSTLLLATPKEQREQLRSGTWATIRYAIKRNVPIRIVYPDGTIGIL